MYKVIVWCPLSERQQARLREQGYEIEMFSGAGGMSEDELVQHIAQFDALIVGLDPIGRAMMAAGDRLKVVSRFGIGLDSVDVQAATELGIVVTNTPGASKVAVAELSIGLMFSLVRQLPQHHAWTKAGKWERRLGVELFGKTLGVMGLGNIGKEVARRAVSLGMRVVAFDPFWDDQFADKWGIERLSKEQVLREADIVTLHLPMMPETAGFIGAEELEMMKPGAMVVNAARGGLVDGDALHDALAAGHLGGAAMDVFVEEPPKPSPLLQLENVILSPHLGGETEEAHENLGRMATDNAIAVLRGERPPNVVNPEVLDHLRPL
jgi:D-3-phosphoglycerate dehydrogenase